MQAGYRPDIDGLRAIAILPVLAFHANIPGVSGGFAGVDVFFVISGYLITSLLYDDLKQGRYSIAHFYERRIRRIFPALFVMLLVNLAVCTLLFLPDDFSLLPMATLAALFFFANIQLAGNVDYFAPDLSVQPLMHSWSLSVEEQFYLLFPLALWLVYRLARRHLMLAIAATALLSFAWNLYLSGADARLSYFSTPARVWELLAGSLLAIGAVPQVQPKRIRSLLAVSGLALIFAAFRFFDEDTKFPGWAALAPVLGTALLIHCAPGTLVGKCLSLRWLVAIGLISYSLYLWHWPVLIWIGYVSDSRVTGMLSATALAATFALALLSYLYVERPTRKWRSRTVIFGGATAGAALLAGGAVLANMAGGWPQRFSPEALRVASYSKAYSPKRSACHQGEQAPIRFRAECVLGAPVAPSAAVLGDSHGVELSFALGEGLGREGGSAMQMTYSNCPPGVGMLANETDGCRQFREAALAYLSGRPDIRTIYLAGHLDQPQYRHSREYFGDYAALVKRLQLMGKQVVIFYPVPQQEVQVPRLLALRTQWDQPLGGVGISDDAFNERMAETTAFLDSIEGVRRVQTAAQLCKDGRCAMVLDDFPAYYDDNHLSLPAAKALLAGEGDKPIR